MSLTTLVDVSMYRKFYGLECQVIGLERQTASFYDLNRSGLIMHGSIGDPTPILEYGLVPQKTDKTLDDEWQVCLGISSNSEGLTLEKDCGRKNPAVKYADNFGKKGIVYLLSEEVKTLKTYKESWVEGSRGGGIAWVTEPINPTYIEAVITKNLPFAAAAISKMETQLPIYKPDGKSYIIVDID